MKKYEIYIHEGMDLTLDEIEIDPNEIIPEVPEHLVPTEEMQERFRKNAVRDGILKIVTLH